MKQTIKNAKMITVGLFTLCTMGFVNATFAGATTDAPVELKFIGKVANQPVFELKLNNDVAQAYYINIKDASGNVLYSEKVRGEKLSRKYQLDIDASDMDAPGFGVSVEVTSANTHKTEVYKISAEKTVTENIVVAKL